MITKMSAAECLDYARRVAYKMWPNDPEAMSIAGIAAWRAMLTFDPAKNVPEKRWIARQVKFSIYYHWRKRAKLREENLSGLWWEKTVYIMPEKLYEEIGQADMSILHEYYIEHWAMDVIARRHNTTKYNIRLRINAAVARLKEVCDVNT